MNLTKKNVAFLALGGVVILILIVVLSDKKSGEIADLSLSPTPTASPDTGTINTPGSNTTTSPVPGIIAEEVQDYSYWFKRLDYQNRVLAVYDECDYLVPSNVAYKNNTQVMLDNTRSEQKHVLKIGPTEYQLNAGEWQLVTLSTNASRPVNLPIFCKGIELGQIELQ